MTRPADHHLESSELELMLSLPLSIEISGNESLREVELHLQTCESCRSMLKKFRNAEEKLDRLHAARVEPNELGPREAMRESDCPPDDTWIFLAAKMTPEDTVARHVNHAATCDRCGLLLRSAIEDLSPTFSPEDQAALDALDRTFPVWHQEKLNLLLDKRKGSAKLDDSESSERTPAFSRIGDWFENVRATSLQKVGWGVCGFVVAIVVVGVGWVTWPRSGPRDVNQLLAQAYSEQRTIELRMPGAVYAPMRQERGAGARDYPSSFYKAKDIISSQSSQHRDDPAWLQAEARAHMLEWKPEDGLKEINRALDLKPNSDELLLDRATVLFQLGEQVGPQAIEYGKAINDLSLVLKKKPDDPVALFNRAIIYERMNAFPDLALNDFEHYLLIDPSGPWASEAQEHISELRKQIEDSRRKDSEFLQPSDILSRVNPSDKSTWQVVDSRIEDYLEKSTTDWLPTVYTNSGNRTHRTTLKALTMVALILEQKHSDLWLSEMLSHQRSKVQADAVTALQQAIISNKNGDIEGARVASIRAQRLFAKSGSAAGTARAMAELVYVFHRSSDAIRCLNAARRLGDQIHGRQYAWLDSYVLIEQAVGSNLQAHLGDTRQLLSEAVEKTKTDTYPVLHLRALGMEASLRRTEGDIVDGWSKDIYGLTEYRNGIVSPLRAYQFYTDLALAAETEECWQLAYTLREKAVRMNALTGDHARGFTASLSQSRTARMAGLLTEADRAHQDAAEELKHLPPSESTSLYEIYNQLELAKLDEKLGKPNDGLALLTAMRPRIEKSSNLSLSRDFGMAEGDLLRSLNQPEGAKNAYWRAIRVAALELASLNVPRDRLAWQSRTEELNDRLVELEEQTGGTTKALALLEWHRGAVFEDHGSDRPKLLQWDPPSFQFPNSLAKNGNIPTAILIYDVFPKEVIVWVVTDGQTVSKAIPISSNQLARVERDLYDECADPSSSIELLRRNSRQLFDILIAPIQHLIPRRAKLLIDSGSFLRRVPFSALLDEKQHYISAEHLIALIPGAGYLNHLHAYRPLTRSANGVFVGMSSSGSDRWASLTPLPGAVTELHRLGRTFVKAKVLTGDDLEEGGLKQGLAQADLFHFAGHTLSRFHRTSLLISSRNGKASYFDAIRLREMRFKRLQLAVLSGCSTGIADEGDFPQLDQLVEVYLEMGVPVVVATQWDVDSAAMEDEMERFYEQIAEGKTAIYSLNVSTETTRKQLATSHPYYWAGIVAFGTPN